MLELGLPIETIKLSTKLNDEAILSLKKWKAKNETNSNASGAFLNSGAKFKPKF
jgi:hypothetical protein